MVRHDDDSPAFKNSLSGTGRTVYLAAVRGVIVRDKKPTHLIVLNRPFIFKIEATAYCTAEGYQCRTTLVYLYGNRRVIMRDY